jgi:hypothetical protein
MGGGPYQKQTTFSEAFLPLLQIGLAALAVALAAADVLVFLWLLKQTAAILVFWPCAVYSAWKHKTWVMVACIAAALGALAAAFAFAWPLHPTAAWWLYARVVAIPVTLFVPVGCYHVVKRMITDARHPNLANSVRARTGSLVDGAERDRIEYKAEDKPAGFDWN